ncbi:MAG: uroporphyrinogen-III C-methyltransferase [Gammaproteobacteria bacterium]|nr:uroporphyrinogen-III C-methyltransferase [Gammaproteobacteria bacterium]
MSKKDSSSDTGKGSENEVADNTDPVVFDADPDSPDEAGDKPAAEPDPAGAGEPSADDRAGDKPGPAADDKTGDKPEPAADDRPVAAFTDKSGGKSKAETDAKSESRVEVDDKSGSDTEPVTKPPSKSAAAAAPKPRRSWFSLFNFLLIIGLAAAVGYYWWLQQQAARDYRETISDLRQQLDSRASNSRLDSSLAPMKSEIGGLESKIGSLTLEQQGLREASEKLFELYGRDKNDWQFAEVEYLMRIAQHKLILQDDFEGAALTLQAASDKIAQTGDTGLLPVRVMISEEIADLKTRKRPDLVGMTLILAQLARQVRVLEPGFAVRVEETTTQPQQLQASKDWLDRLGAFIDSLVEVRHETAKPTEIEASIADVSETLEDNLKLARWAVLDRDARQYDQLISQSLRLLREFYDLDNAANNDFMRQLQDLQKMQLKPEKPDITGSLRELQRILSQRENAPEPATKPATESGNG